MSRSKIEWTDRTWNPVRGCSRVSEGCRNCYAERQAARFSRPLVQDQAGEYAGGDPFAGFARMTREGPRWTGRVELIPSKLSEPLQWRKPARVFVNSMSDLFHESLPFEAIDHVFAVMARAPLHTFQVLTKRPERMREYFSENDGLSTPLRIEDVQHRMLGRQDDEAWASTIFSRWPLPNVWLGVSVEDQPTADARWPALAATPAAKRFISYEPALGPVDFTGWFSAHYCDGGCDRYEGHAHDMDPGIDWIIVGGESGPGSRPMHPDWVRSTRDQCRDAGVAFFFKQWGAWRPPLLGEAYDTTNGRAGHPPAFLVAPDGTVHCTRDAAGPDAAVMVRRDGKNADPSEWPEDLRVREVPT